VFFNELELGINMMLIKAVFVCYFYKSRVLFKIFSEPLTRRAKDFKWKREIH